MERKLQTGSSGPYEGRNTGGVIKSALAYFEALGEMGIQSNLKEFSEFDFSKSDFYGSTIILAHQIAIHSRYWQNLSDFVSRGGKLIIDGLTAYFDENAICVMKTGFPFEDVFGGNIKEFIMVGDQFRINLKSPVITLPSHMWRGTIRTTTAKTIGTYDKESVAVRNFYGKGEVIWVPSLLGLGARIKGDYGPLSVFLYNEINQSLTNVPVRFKLHQPGMLMKTLQSGSDLITIVINKSRDKRTVPLTLKKGTVNPVIMFADKGGTATAENVNISPEETLVIKWNFESE